MKGMPITKQFINYSYILLHAVANSEATDLWRIQNLPHSLAMVSNIQIEHSFSLEHPM